MSENIYIFSNGELKRKQNTIYFEVKDGNHKYLPVENIREIHLFGEVILNKDALEFLSQKEIILHFYNYYGYYVGSFYPREHYNSGYILLKQVEHYLDFEKRRYLALKFVEGAISNIITVLSYYRRKGINLESLDKINALYQNLFYQNTIEEIMAIEGKVREIYYSEFNKIIENKEFIMDKRSKKPPENQINALISFGNSLLYSYILSEIYKTHLDPRIGYLHATNFRRFTLNLDIAEIFKPIIVDRVIFYITNKNMLSSRDFEEKLNGIYLKESGRKIFISKIEEKLRTTVFYKKLGKNVSYRRLIRMELYKLEKHLIGDEKYYPLISEW
ncbi:MAG: type I-B CRISPR-associated endonuclease Cas1b [Dictyoglomus sp.]|nr:type I-B CRISPR-associated endonuclease Cas1b [Dictyoglomus sp.]MCX7941701.1 type I-B CRISPR-associated endonuclease Cas1b [Dictyoglomaceae bacterium]MDW8189077.1 type I-B CRISPR-associated endonuclease Cas1b [Dictyoglomus sp.]